MNDDWQWLIGLLAGMGLAIVGGFRNVYKRISEGHGDLHKKIDHVKENYVPKDHLETHLEGIHNQLDDLKEGQRQQIERQDKIIAKLVE